MRLWGMSTFAQICHSFLFLSLINVNCCSLNVVLMSSTFLKNQLMVSRFLCSCSMTLKHSTRNRGGEGLSNNEQSAGTVRSLEQLVPTKVRNMGFVALETKTRAIFPRNWQLLTTQWTKTGFI